MSRSFVVLLRQANNDRLLQNSDLVARPRTCHRLRGVAKGRVGRDGDAVGLAEVNQRLVGQVGVDFDFIVYRLRVALFNRN